MTRKNNLHLRTMLQNALILLLTASALFLFLKTGLVRTGDLRHMFSSVSQAAVPSDSAGANWQFPLQIAVRSGGECRAWLDQTTTGDIFEDVGPLLTEALGSANGVTAVDEEEFRRALENNSIYYDFKTVLPLPLLAQTLGSDESPHVSARALLLSNLQDTTAALYAWSPEENTYYRWSTTVSSDNLASAVERNTGTAAEFAYLSDAPYNALAPCTLISQEQPVLFDLSAASAESGSDGDILLTRLEFNVHSNSRYKQSDGTEVIKQGMRTLRFSPNGSVSYSGSSDDGVDLLQIPHTGESATQLECANGAWKTADTLLSDRLGDATLYLRSITSDAHGNAEIQFGYMVNGYPIVFPDGYAAKITITENAITDMTLQLRTYTLSETAASMLPVLQAAAAVQGETPELFPGYLDDGSDLLSPCWLQR